VTLAETPEELDRFLRGVDAMTSRRSALRAVLALWTRNPVLSPYLDDMEQNGDAFEFVAKQNELDAHRVRADLELLAKLNVPAVLRMSVPGGVVPRYLTLSGIEGDQVTLRGGGNADGLIRTRAHVLYARWTGEAYLFWKNFLNCQGTLPIQADREAVITLKMLLQDIGFENIQVTPYYDEQVRDAVEAVQRRNGIKVDGIVGPVTKIVLYNEKKDLEIPHLVREPSET
jgi:general secretion pathway protein A